MLNERLAREGVGPLCHLAVVNLATGDVEHRLTIEGVVEELYDVAVLPGVIRPSVIGFRTDEIRFLVRPAARLSSLRRIGVDRVTQACYDSI